MAARVRRLATCGPSCGTGSCGGNDASTRAVPGDISDAVTAEETDGPPTVTWCCSTRPQSAPSATTTGEHASQHHGRLVRKGTTTPYRDLWRARCSVMGT